MLRAGHAARGECRARARGSEPFDSRRGGAAVGRAGRVSPQGDSPEPGAGVQVRPELRLEGLARARAQSAARRSAGPEAHVPVRQRKVADRKSTRLNSSHSQISYAVFCLKKKIIQYASVPLA